MPYHIIFSDSEGESVVGIYGTLEAAKTYLHSIRYYPSYMRSAERLDISDDGMSGSGYDSENGSFTYTIESV